MNKTTKIILILLLVLIVGYLLLTKDGPSSKLTTHPESDLPTQVTTQNEDTIKTAELMTDEVMPVVAGKYVTYSPEAVADSPAEYIILNFSATWCPSCRVVDKDISNNLDNIPSNIEIYKVDYDSNLDLRKKYGVTVQHTFVVVDNTGKMLDKWTGGSTLKDVLNHL